MPHYKARFYGRTKGAIGIFYWIDAEVDADDPESARLRLYDRYEHIQQITLREVSHDHQNQYRDK